MWEAASGTLFSGDIVYDGPLIEDTYHSNAEDYIASMRRLLEIPVRLVHGGYYLIIPGSIIGSPSGPSLKARTAADQSLNSTTCARLTAGRTR